MGCCGQARSAQRMGATGRPDPDPAPSRVSPGDPSLAYFQYTGRTATGVTLVGGLTGTRYRFEYPGAIVPVDARDRRSLAGVAVLRQLPGP